MMKNIGMVVGGLLMILGVSIMVTPLRTYFIIGWIAGCVLLFNGLPLVFSGISKKNRSKGKCLVGGVTVLIGIILLITDVKQILSQVLIVNLIAGGIMLSGLIECIIGYGLLKRYNQFSKTLILGIISLVIGLAGLIFRETTVVIIGIIVGYHILRVGISIFTYARRMESPAEIRELS